MTTRRLTRQIALLAGGAAIVGMGALSAGSTKEKEAPPTTPTTSEAPASVAPTEKAVGPGGNNSFSPTINPKPPGAVCTQIVNGVCVR
jgi:hypothetical protein